MDAATAGDGGEVGTLVGHAEDLDESTEYVSGYASRVGVGPGDVTSVIGGIPLDLERLENTLSGEVGSQGERLVVDDAAVLQVGVIMGLEIGSDLEYLGVGDLGASSCHLGLERYDDPDTLGGRIRGGRGDRALELPVSDANSVTVAGRVGGALSEVNRRVEEGRERGRRSLVDLHVVVLVLGVEAELLLEGFGGGGRHGDESL